ncbi:MAG: branched-chain amino acid ABC transporter permease [Betaproteobacteria bacterium]|nr:branched-chain amino acid ABC transporter permease [Betaproteobacteria bacterium]
MRFIFKTRYEQDLQFFKDRHHAFWYALLLMALLMAPWLGSEYFQTQLIFIFISALVGYGLMLLAGFTGQMSMGHAAFLAIGAYAEAYLQARGLPFIVSAPCAMLASAFAGILIGLPALRLSGLYLAIATLAFGFIVEEALARWESVTGGNAGMMLAPLKLVFAPLESDTGFYYLCLALLILVGIGMKNLLRAPTGSVNLARFKTLSFALSAAVTGLAGALYAHQIKFLSPEQFTVLVSIEFLMMVVIGGLGSLHGAVFGAMFIILLPEAISMVKDWLPESIAGQTGLKATLFGLIMILFVIFEPLGLYGAWLKMRTYFSLFPLYKRGLFKRQRSYTRSERVH